MRDAMPLLAEEIGRVLEVDGLLRFVVAIETDFLKIFFKFSIHNFAALLLLLREIDLVGARLRVREGLGRGSEAHRARGEVVLVHSPLCGAGRAESRLKKSANEGKI